MNRRDASAAVLMDVDLGMAVDLVDPVVRVKRRTLRKAALSRKILLDSQAEELRVLYVALTRAKEKLIITGVTDDAAKLLQGKAGICCREEVSLPYSVVHGEVFMLKATVMNYLPTSMRVRAAFWNCWLPVSCGQRKAESCWRNAGWKWGIRHFFFRAVSPVKS